MNGETKTRIEKILNKNFANLNLSENIVRQLTSIDLVTLVSYLEDEFKIVIHAVEFDQEMFASVDKLTAFIDFKLADTREQRR